MRGSKTTRLECQWFAFEQGVSYGTDLVHGRLDFSGSGQYPSLEIVFVKVADTDTPKCFLNFHSMGNREYRKDAPRQTSFLDLFRLGPSRGDIGNGETCPMNQIQVNIPHPSYRRRRQERTSMIDSFSCAHVGKTVANGHVNV